MVGFTKYVDVNVFVYWLGHHPEFGDVAYKWVKKIEESTYEGFLTSSLTVYEALIILAGLTSKNLKDRGFVKSIIDAVISLKGLRILPLKAIDLLNARDLMNLYELDYEDSLHLAVALRMDAKEIITNDEDFDKTAIKRVF